MNKKRKVNAKYILGGSLIAFGLLTSGCGGSSSSSNKPDSSKNAVSMQGTAAIGSPIANGTLTAKCSDGSGFTNTVTTQANGAWSGTVTSGALPCALQITGGTPNVTLHSFATQAGNVNITPLTDLALALQVNTLSGQSLSDWFSAPNTGSADLNNVENSLVAAADTLRSAMAASNFSLPTDWNTGSTAIFNTPFNANPASDPYDQLLESLAESINDDVNLADYTALMSSLVSGGSFPPAPSNGGGGNLSGNGAALGDLNGATGTIGETTYTYTGDPDSESSLYTYSPLTDSGVIVANNGADPITRWQISGLTGSAGTINCDADEGIPAIMLTLSGQPNVATECVIEIISVSSTEIEGRFSAVFTDLGAVTNGYFRYEEPEENSSGGGLGAQEFGYSMDVDGVSVTNNAVLALDVWDRPVASYLTLGDTPTFKINMIPEGQGGDYSCGDGSPYRTVAIGYDGYFTDNSSYPGTCSISLTYSDKIYSGTFSGTLYNTSGESIVITNGVVRNDGSNL